MLKILQKQLFLLVNSKIMAGKFISRYMDTIGDGTGNVSGNLDFSALEQSFLLSPGPGEIFKVRRLIVFIKGTANVREDMYGFMTALTNGIRILILQNRPLGTLETLTDVTNGRPIKTNADWRAVCHDELTGQFSTGNKTVSYRYSFDRDSTPVILEGDNNQSLAIILNDDFTSLEEHTFRVGLESI